MLNILIMDKQKFAIQVFVIHIQMFVIQIPNVVSIEVSSSATVFWFRSLKVVNIIQKFGKLSVQPFCGHQNILRRGLSVPEFEAESWLCYAWNNCTSHTVRIFCWHFK